MQDEVRQGDIIKVEGLEGYYKVISLQKLGTVNKVELFSLKNNNLLTILSPPYELRTVASPLQLVKEGKFDSSVKFDLFVEAKRFSLIHLYDPLASLSVTKVDALPHQIEAVYRRMLDVYEPNFLLADDAGLGKTIMTGMLIKELKLRGRIKRILVIVPAALQFTVWQKELSEKFGEKFEVFTSEFIRSLYGANPSVNPWKLPTHNQVITSIDFARKPEILEKIAEAEWDIIIFDEAHKLSAHRKSKGEERTYRYRVAETLKDRTKATLLLTATPHSGESYAFFRLVSLVDPYLFASPEEVNKEKLSRIMIRRLKEDVTGFNGEKLFKPREARTLSVKFTEEEWELYEAVTNYVRHYFNLAKVAKNRGVSFAMTILQKRMASSIEAIKKSLKNRLGRLQEILETGKFIEITEEEKEIWERYIRAPDEVDEEEAEEVRKKYEALTMAKNERELKAEIDQLEKLLQLAESIKEDSKAKMLLQFVKDLHEKDPKEKVLVFTEYKDTLIYLRDIFQNAGYKVAFIYGGMDLDSRGKHERDFNFDENVKIMTGTDAAGEGLNLQFSCHIMVNYELPWNPSRIEQRIGRLHRYGQGKVVFIHNIFIDGTVESTVFQRLLDKIDIIKQELGDHVFDVLGILVSDVDLERIIMEAITAKGVVEERIKMAEEKIEEKKNLILQEIEGKSLIRDKLDLEPLKELVGKSKEYAITEFDLERFTRRFFIIHDGRIEPGVTPGVFSLELPKNLSLNGKSVIPLAAFSKEVAKNFLGVEFVALGHPLFEKMLNTCMDYEFGGRTAIKLDPQGRKGVFFIFEGNVITSKGEPRRKKLFAIFHDMQDNECKEVDPRSLQSFEDVDNPEGVSVGSIPIDSMFGKAEEVAINSMNNILEETRERVEREIEIKREDVVRYYDRRINESYRRISDYRSKLPTRDMDIAMRREQARIKQLTEEMNEKSNQLEKERVLSAEAPELLAVAIVLPKRVIAGVSEKDEIVIKEVEEAGMKAAMQYERDSSREPTDVSKEFKGYDIISEGPEGIRYIEVKAFKTTGAIEITGHEWSRAESLKENYWLYVVENALNPEKRRLHFIQNPATTLLEVAEERPIIQFKIIVEKWRDLVQAAVAV